MGSMAQGNKRKSIKFDERRFSTAHMSKVLPSIMKTLGASAEARKSISIIRIMNHWETLVGQDLAIKSSPEKTIYRKQKCKQTGELQTVTCLKIKCDGAVGTVIAMREAIILERLNRMFGTSSFVSLSIEHGYIAPALASKTSNKPAPRHFELDLPEIDDPVLKSRLESLGQAVMNSAHNNKG